MMNAETFVETFLRTVCDKMRSYARFVNEAQCENRRSERVVSRLFRPCIYAETFN
uniref:Uncharacterized protein n=1 Tax=Anguilla anguilla TaxID=7936 RepID=A0A0E9XD27_ANGAN